MCLPNIVTAYALSQRFGPFNDLGTELNTFLRMLAMGRGNASPWDIDEGMRIANQLDAALSESSSTAIEPVYRGLVMLRESIPTGDLLHSGFLSTTTSIAHALRFIRPFEHDDIPVLLKIEGLSGTPAINLSGQGLNEREILFPRNLEFQVFQWFLSQDSKELAGVQIPTGLQTIGLRLKQN